MTNQMPDSSCSYCRLLRLPLLLVSLMVVVGCNRSESSAPKNPAPAKVPNPVKEETLAAVTLTPEAETRLGITTVAAALKPVARSRSYGAEVLVPLRQDRTNGANSSAGGESIFSLFPALTPTEMIKVSEMQVEADGQIAAAEVQSEAAQISLRRAQSLLAEKAASARAVDDAKAQVALAEAAMKTAQKRRQLLGAPIFQAVQGRTIWVRVPVYAGSMQEIDSAAPARIRSLGTTTNQSIITAKPLALPISSSGGSAMVDLFYEAENPGNSIRPGQRVTAEIPLRGQEQSLVLPASVLIYDMHGGTWVYEKTAPHGFTRRRVQVRSMQGDQVAVDGSVRPGAEIVTAGVAELFGTEMGFAK